MPPPVLTKVALPEIVERVAGLETRLRVTVIPGPEIELTVDPDQVEQMLINLVRNAAEAALEPGQTEKGSGNGATPATERAPEVVVSWVSADKDVILNIEDNGRGLLNPANAFVPFYTTKPTGSGIGLVLSRQIAEAHGGSIELANRTDSGGCRARVLLPRTDRGQ